MSSEEPETFNRLQRRIPQNENQTRVYTTTKLARQLEQKVALVVSTIKDYCIYQPGLLDEFEQSQVYKDFTKAPEGNRAIKNIKSRLRKEKESHQEFRFAHLKNPASRKKYGKKFVEKLHASGMITTNDYDNLLEATETMPSYLDDDLYNALVTYYTVPIPTETNWETRRRSSPKAPYVLAPSSGFEIFEKFLVSKGYGGQGLAYLLLVSEEVKIIRQELGDASALRYFEQYYFEISASTKSLERYVLSIKDEDTRGVTLEYLKNVIQKPLQQFAQAVKHELLFSLPQAQLYSVNGVDLAARSVKTANDKKVYWC